ncbi:MAG: ATP-dependent DNA helicase [Methanosarcinales archaeon]|nr:ATP-dependent DNA helicase [Methanosarcinales archaeon]
MPAQQLRPLGRVYLKSASSAQIVYMDYFPFPTLRPYQDQMLDAVCETVQAGEHGVLMIDAPTGCGKTSCLSAALAAAPGKVVVALRTVSQIDIYLDWIGRIWANTAHRPEVSYMVGKQKVCPLSQEFKGESVYSGCSRLRNWTKDFMAARLKRSRDSIYDPSRDQIPEEAPGYRTFCPHYLQSREAFELNGKVYYRRSGQALDVVERLREKVTPAEDLVDACSGVCPYEVMSLYAKSSDIVIMNYSHLFSPDFQDVIFQWLELDPDALTLIVDEAHNLGDAVRAMNTRVLTPRMIDLATKEVEKFEEALGQSRLEEAGGSSWRREGIRTIKLLLPRLQKFIASREKRMQDGEYLLDVDFFREFLYNGFDDIDEALTYFSDVAVSVSEMKLAEGDHENVQGDIQPSLALVLLFLRDMEESERDMSYQSRIATSTVGGRRWTRLEVVQIDPAPVIRRVVDNVSSTVMLSGTFSPLDAYELYCLGQENRARKLSLPNPFPPENRLLLVSARATTQLEAREDMDNRQEIADHIEAIIQMVPGNVAVFFTSYSMMNSYRELCKKAARRAGKKLYLEPRSSEEVATVLAEFFRQGGLKGAVLLGVCGGKLAEGIDYKGETLNGVAVVGLPLGVYDEIQREINDYYARKYGKEKGILIAYTLPAINRGLQAAGRVIRAEDERGVILFCDRRFNTAGLGGVKEYLPEWVRGELMAADASQCREIIRDKQIDWSQDSPPPCQMPEKSSPGKPGKPGGRKKTRDLKSLAKDLGLGKVR